MTKDVIIMDGSVAEEGTPGNIIVPTVDIACTKVGF
jgi:hypothetical protein